MSTSRYDRMSKEQVVSWFSSAPEIELAEVLRDAVPVRDAPDHVGESIPLLLTSILLPVELVRDLDEVAAAEGLNRSEVIRIAVAVFLRQRRAGLEPHGAE